MINAMPNQPRLTILLLGPVKVQYGNTAVKINRRAERAILYYLAAEHRPISRQRLIDLLWPETGQADPRSTLRTALSRLRNDLPDPATLITDLDQVGLDFERCHVDVLIFEQQFQDLHGQLHIYGEQRPLPAHLVRQIEATLSLWRGDRFIAGENLENYAAMLAWQHGREVKLHHQRRILMQRLSQHYRTSGRPETALQLLYLMQKINSLNTATHVDILDVLADLGQHEEILTFCDELEMLYEQSFGQPLPDEILTRCHLSQVKKTCHRTRAEIPWPYPPGMHLQLAGRQGELEALRQAFYAGGFMVIYGEGGSGKTRLVQELYETLHPRPKLIAAPGRPLENTLPLSPLIHSLRHDIPETQWKTLPKVWIAALSRLLPELRNLQPDIPDPQELFPEDTQHIFHALFTLYIRLAKENNRLLFFLDDAQWADLTTLQALTHLLSEGLFQHHGLLITAVRTEEPAPELQEMIDRLRRTQTIKTLHLTGLDQKALSHLVKQVFNQSPNPSFVDRLHRETNGNPFMALEILRTILEQPGGMDYLKSPGPLPLPDNVHALIRKRLDQLSEGARSLMTCAAVLGTSFPRHLLMAISGIQEEKAVAYLETLHQSGFLTTADISQAVTFQFTHEKVREVILMEASAVKIQTWHLKTARFLTAEPRAETRAGVIATHYRMGREIRSAFQWYLRAADYAWSLGAKDESLNAFQQAENLFKNAPAGFFSDEDILSLYEKWAEFAYQSNQTAMLEQTAVKLQYLGERENAPLLIGAAQTSRAHAHFLTHAFSEGLAAIDEAIHHLKKADHPRLLIEAYIRQGTLFLWTNRYRQAIEGYQNALQISKGHEQDKGFIPAIFKARYQISLAFYALGESGRALRNAEAIHDQFYHRVGPFNRIRTESALANAHLLMANFDECRRYALQGLEMARNLDSRFIQEDILITLARAETLSGQLDSAYVHTHLALDLGETNQHPGTVIRANCILGDIFNLIQNYSRALAYYRAGQIEEGFFKTSYHAIENDIHLARLLVWTGEIAEGQRILNECLEITEKVQMKQLWAQALVISGICHLLEGQMSAAEQDLETAATLVRKNNLRHEAYWVWIGQARIAMIENNHDKAIQILQRLLADSLENNSPWTALYGAALLAQLFKATGQEGDQEKMVHISSQIIQDISRHAFSTPLQSDFNKTKARWQAGHFYP